jgi:predicted nucleic acid-binding protein
VIGGKVLDASFVAALVRGSLAAGAWLDTARLVGLALYLPTLVLAEVRAVCPDAGGELAELLGHPGVILGELDATAAAQVEQLLTEAGAFDALAGHIIHIARTRGWPVLTADPSRLRRIAPDLDLELL